MSEKRLPEVAIDWSKVNGTEIEILLDWIRSYPRRTAVHVTLPARHPERRILQGKLQLLGCGVAMRR